MPQDFLKKAQESVQEQIPTVEFNPRTGEPLFGSDYYKNNPAGTVTKDTVTAKPQQSQQPKVDTKPHRGMWLSRKLNGLKTDPKYLQGSDEQKKHWNQLAYDKWVIPYYKNILKTDPPSYATLFDPQTHASEYNRAQFWEKLNNKAQDPTQGLRMIKEASHVMAGFQDDLAFVGSALDFVFDKTVGSLDRESRSKTEKLLEKDYKGEADYQKIYDAMHQGRSQARRPLKDKMGPIEEFYSMQQPFRERERLVQEQIENLEINKKKSIVEKVADHIPGFVTDTVFFEVTGGRSAASALSIKYPKAAAFLTRRAIDSLNGAVDFALWNKSTGESGVEGAKAGAVFGPIVTPILKTIFNFGGPQTTKRVVMDAVEKASGKTEQTAPKETAKEFLERLLPKPKPHPTVEKATQVISDEINEYAQKKFGKPYKDLPFIQKQHVLNRVTAEVAGVQSTSSVDTLPKEIIQAASQEEQETINQIFPEAKKAQQQVDQFIQQNGGKPVQNKMLASLPHHNTTIDSSWKHLQARASFLKSRLQTAKGEEAKQITEALNEEYRLMKEKAEREKILKAASEGKFKAQGIRDFLFGKRNLKEKPLGLPKDPKQAEWFAKQKVLEKSVNEIARDPISLLSQIRSSVQRIGKKGYKVPTITLNKYDRNEVQPALYAYIEGSADARQMELIKDLKIDTQHLDQLKQFNERPLYESQGVTETDALSRKGTKEFGLTLQSQLELKNLLSQQKDVVRPKTDPNIELPLESTESEAVRQKAIDIATMGGERQTVLDAAKKGKFRAEASREGRTVGLPEYTIQDVVNTPFSYSNPFTEWSDSFARGVQRSAQEQARAKGQEQSFLGNAISNSYMIGNYLLKKVSKYEGFTKTLYHPQYGLVGGLNYEFQNPGALGEHSLMHPKDNILYINYLGMRPNVVARIWDVPGGGQTLFLEAAKAANDANAGIALIPYDESQSFYEKMGMHHSGSYMVMTPEEVKSLLRNKGLLMMLMGAGITYGASNIDKYGDYSVKGQPIQ